MGNRPQTSTADWIEAGYAAVGRGGFEAVSIEALAAELGVSKAGFYHRFRDRQALLDAITDHWILCREEYVQRFADDGEPGTQIRNLLGAALADDRLRQADAWILLHDPADSALASRTRVVREQFLEFGKRQLLALGFGEHQAEVRARLLYTGYIGLVANVVAQSEPVDPAYCQVVVDQLADMITTPNSSMVLPKTKGTS